MSLLVVVGDALLDRDLDGRADRLSPDAPVPVVSRLSEVDASRRRRAGRAARRPGRRRGRAGHRAGRRPGRARGGRLLAARRRPRGRRPAAGRDAGQGAGAGGRAVAAAARPGGEPRAPRPVTPAAVRRGAAAGAVLVSDYGRGLAADPALRAAVPPPPGASRWCGTRIRAAPTRCPGARAGDPEPGRGAAVRRRRSGGSVPSPPPARAGPELTDRWRVGGVAVTLGARRRAARRRATRRPLVVPAPPPAAGDPCGAGDRFAATAAGRLAAGALPSEAVTAAVAAASAYVAAGGAGVRAGRPCAPARAGTRSEVVRRVRRGAAPWWPPAAASTCCTPGTWPPWRRPARWATAWSSASTPTRRSAGSRDRGGRWCPSGTGSGCWRRSACVDAVTVFGEDTPHAVLDAPAPGRVGQGRRLRRPGAAGGRAARRLGRPGRGRALPGRPVDDRLDRAGAGWAHGMAERPLGTVLVTGGAVRARRRDRAAPWPRRAAAGRARPGGAAAGGRA